MLNSLDKLVEKRKVVGRGGSRGGTSGKGHKGQRARSGGYHKVGFEGGQMPLTRRIPKRGFNNAMFKQLFEIVNIDRLNEAYNAGDVVNRETLFEKGIIKNIKNAQIKILGSGSLDKKLIIHADAFSESAKTEITNKGGEVHLVK